MKCLNTGSQINDENWRKQPVCNCANCQEFFKKLRETYHSGKPLELRMIEQSKCQLDS